jgi:hypothetical protein
MDEACLRGENHRISGYERPLLARVTIVHSQSEISPSTLHGYQAGSGSRRAVSDLGVIARRRATSFSRFGGLERSFANGGGNGVRGRRILHVTRHSHAT